MLKKILSVLCILCLLFSFAGCDSKQSTMSFDSKVKPQSLDDSVVAKNDKFELSYNESNYGVTVRELATGEVWGTSPQESGEVEFDEFGLPKVRNYRVESVFLLQYLEYTSNTEVTAYSYDAVREGRVTCKKIKNGIKINYYLDSIKIMIPVSFVLNDGFVSVSVDPKEIQENENKVVKISLAPFWCGVKNDSINSYLFVPSGQGAIVTPETRNDPVKTFSAFVYGADYAMEKKAEVTTETNVLLPVYGAKTSNTSAVCAVIEKGAESAVVEVDAGDSMIGYSAVYPTFVMRGYTYHTSTLFSSKKVDSTVYAEDIIGDAVSVRFYPISGEKSDYVGIAEKYRGYLDEVYGLEDKAQENVLNLTVVGGTMITESFLGVPYETLYPATTLNDAYEIIKDLSDELGSKFSVKLKGFGKTGVDVGHIGGKFVISNALGDKKDLKRISKISSGLFMDFDLLRYCDGSNGFSPYFDSISTTGIQKAYQYEYDKAVNNAKQNTLYYLLKPKYVSDAAEKLIQKTEKWGITGYSLDTLSSMLYSDYSDRKSSKYYSRNGSTDENIKAFETVKESKKDIMTACANDYAAIRSSTIVDVPLANSGSYIFTTKVPFYQTVFKGYIPMYTESVNLAADKKEMILGAVESGCGLGFTVVKNWDNTLIDANYPYFYNSCYDDIKEDLIGSLKHLADYYKKISGAKIVSHTLITNVLRKTVFDNGVCVYVNYGNLSAETPHGTVAAKDFIVREGIS